MRLSKWIKPSFIGFNFIYGIGNILLRKKSATMRINNALFAMSSKSARRPQLEPVPFQMLLPLQLKKTVSGKSDKQKEVACMQELAVMFGCFKKHEFNQQECLKEVAEFQGCYKNYSEKAAIAREMGKKGTLVPGEKKMTHRQMNQLLKAFPPTK